MSIGGKVLVNGRVVAGGLALPAAVVPPVEFSLTSAAVAHDPGAWAVVSASLPAAVNMIYTAMTASNANNGLNSSTLLEIGTGAPGAETVVASISSGYRGAGLTANLPKAIPAGTRVVARSRSIRVSFAVVTSIALYAYPFSIAATTDEWGTITASSKGTGLAAPAALNTYTPWDVVTASTPAALQALHLTIQGNNAVTLVAQIATIQMGYGPVGLEVPVATWRWLGGSSETYQPLEPLLQQAEVPAASRLVIRWQRPNVALAVDYIAHGVRAA